MTFATIAIVVALVGLVVLFLLWRTVKFFVRLALVGVVLLALLVGFFLMWGWYGPEDGRRDGRNRNAPARRTTNRP